MNVRGDSVHKNDISVNETNSYNEVALDNLRCCFQALIEAPINLSHL